MQEIIITAYPKSGITWLIHMVADLLDSPQIDQDEPGYPAYYWGQGRHGGFVIRKRHDPYSEQYAGKFVIRTQRDPRDVLISAMYYRNNTAAGLLANFFGQGVNKFTMAKQYETWETSWDGIAAVETRYKWLIDQPGQELAKILAALGQPEQPEKIKQVIENHRFGRMKTYMQDDHFMRRGQPGDWANYFNQTTGKIFNDYLGAYMLKTGYIQDLNWYKNLR